MQDKPVRFVHASDLHLERPLFGVAEIPTALRTVFLDAPYLAAQRVFDFAISERVDFVVLSGDCVAIEASGPRGPLFLVEQFQRLADKEIAVYWAGGHVDSPEHWPAVLRLPDTVHLFAHTRPEVVIHERRGVPVAQLFGQSSVPRGRFDASEFVPRAGQLPTIGVVHGHVDAAAVGARQIGYWALGGSHEPQTVHPNQPTIHQAGSPQGRHPREAGRHSCTLVEWPAGDVPRLTPVPTDVVRWVDAPLAAQSLTSRDALERALFDRAQQLINSQPDVPLLVSWTVQGADTLELALRRGRLATDLLNKLRNEFGARKPPFWSLSLEVETTSPKAVEDDHSLVGEFLRAVDRCRHTPFAEAAEALNLPAYYDAAKTPAALAAAVHLDSPADLQRVLHDAALIGHDLLSDQEVHP